MSIGEFGGGLFLWLLLIAGLVGVAWAIVISHSNSRAH